jgi:hypothetical protein
VQNETQSPLTQPIPPVSPVSSAYYSKIKPQR